MDTKYQVGTTTLIEAKDAEINRLRAELANKATTAVLERVAAAQSADPGTDDLTVCLALEVADLEAVNSKLRAAARRDAEHITRLGGLLERWLRHADSGLWRDRTDLRLEAAPIADDTRAALAPRPPEGKGE